MNLVEAYNSLDTPNSGNRNLFNAITLADFPFVKIAINNEGLPVILISSVSNSSYITQKNVRLKHLELTHNLECKVSENDSVIFQSFTVIIFNSSQESLQRYFLGIAETLIKSLSQSPTQQEILHLFKNFVEIFRTLTEIPTKTMQGLWGELFVMYASREPVRLLNYWHTMPEEKFDFNADNEKLEVKTSSTFERIHTFSSEQLNPPLGKEVLIASLFVKQSTNGQSISQLVSSLHQKLEDTTLIEKLYSIVSRTLGNSIEQSIKIKFDIDIAKNSLRFYRYQDVHKIEKIYIPNKVSEVRYKSDLTDIVPIELPLLKGGGLFRGL
ncbi:MAG: PD-(D/E)XK motif protein [Cyclobacteriaceae bacterium]|nr:PD-(D/E)XK motif protein [Cyclobacteriaceae bacterium]